MYLLLYIDDMLLACKSLTELKLLKEMLKGEFVIKDLRRAKKILGMEIYRDREKIVLTILRKVYIEKVLQRFGMQGANSISTLLLLY